MTKLGLEYALSTLRMMRINLAEAEARKMHKAVKNIKASIKNKEEKIKNFYRYGENADN